MNQRSGSYVTFLPEADKVVWKFGDDVAVVLSDGAIANFRLSIEDLLTHLLQLCVVTVKEDVPPQLSGSLHGAEATVSPQTVPLLFTREAKR